MNRTVWAWMAVVCAAAVGAWGAGALASPGAGNLMTWGYNVNGELADGSSLNRSSPAPMIVPNWTAASLSAGNYHTLALKSDGTVWAWGWANLGDGVNGVCSQPVQAAQLNNVSRVVAGTSFSFAIKGDGTLWAWGNNNSGQLGDGTITDRMSPVQVTALSGVAQVAAGSLFGLALKSDGSVWAWGTNSRGQLGDGTTTERHAPVSVSGLTNVVAIAAGDYHGYALKADGTVWAWGWNLYGQLGDGTTTARLTPVQVLLSGPAVGISSGGYWGLAILQDGRVSAWGDNDVGELGNGTTNQSATPVLVQGLTGVTAVAVGNNGHNLALTGDGTVYAWGYNGFGELGDGTLTTRLAPVPVPGAEGATEIAAGPDQSYALTGGVWLAWGRNSYSQLGDGRLMRNPSPRLVAGLDSAVVLSLGDYHGLAVRSDGTVWAWGRNSQGLLGDGTDVYRSTPVQVTTLAGMTSVAAGTNASLALKSDGTVWSWGWNGYGQLGDGTLSTRTSPVQVLGLTGCTAVAIGYWHGLALKGDGTVWAWGRNNNGQLGDGTTTNRATAVQVSGLSGVVAVACGADHSLALKSDGTVWAWGSNRVGQLGDGTYVSNSTTPVQVVGLTSVQGVNGGGEASGAVKSDGTVWMWGNRNPRTATQVAGLSGVTAFSMSSQHQMALEGDGSVWTWGSGAFGQLGDGTYTSHGTPVKVMDGGVAAVSAGGSFSGALLACSYTCAATVPSTASPGTLVAFHGAIDSVSCSDTPDYEWSFGDGSPNGYGADVTHTYTGVAPGDTKTWTLWASMGIQTCTQVGTITMTCPALVLSPSGGTETLSVGWVYSTQFTVAGGTPPYTFGYSGTLPPGTTLSPSGLFSGTPTTVGHYGGTVTAADADGCTGSQTYVINVVAPPVVTSIKKTSPPFKFVVTGSNLQQGIQVVIDYTAPDPAPWPTVTWKKTTKIQIGGGAALKAKVPKGVSVNIAFVNPDGGVSAVNGWTW